MAEVKLPAATGMRMSLHMEGLEQTDAALKRARKEFSRRLGAIQQDAAESTVLPAARLKAAHYKIAGTPIRSAVTIRANRAGGVALTTTMRGTKARAVGLLEFGGTVGGVIYPKGTVLLREDGKLVQAHTKKKALTVGPGGKPIARITTPRVYRARQFLTKARDRELPAFGEEARDRIVAEFAQEGFTIS